MIGRALAIACALGFSALGVSAQPITDESGSAQAAGEFESDAVLNARAARALARVTLLDLRITGDVTPLRMGAARDALGVALRLSPDDQELSRLRLEAAYGADDRDAVREETRRLIRIDPSDTVAQLRLIASRIAELDTAEARIAAYEKYLAAGDRVDASVRSRLALDAALMERELGDLDGFADKLEQAMSLDVTNKEAASLAWSFYSGSVDDRAGRLSLLSNLLLADPLDPNVQRWIALELAAAGAWDQAERFHANARLLYGTENQERMLRLELERLSLIWGSRGGAALVAEMDKRLEGIRYNVNAQLRQLHREYLAKFDNEQRAGRDDEELLEGFGPPEDFVMPEDTRLGIEAELMRYYAAVDARDRETLIRSRSDLRRSTGELMDATVAQQEQNPQDADLQRGLAARWQDLGLTMLRALALSETIEPWPLPAPQQEVGEGDGDAQEESQTAEAPVGVDPGAVIEGHAIANLILGSLPEVLALDEEIAGFEGLMEGQDTSSLLAIAAGQSREPAWSMLGEAVALRDAGDIEGAGGALRAAVDAAPLGVTAGVARIIARTIDGFELFPPAQRRAAESVAQGVPEWADQMVRTPASYMTFSIAADRATSGAFESNPLKIRLQNTSRTPLGVGPDRPLNSDVMVSPRVTLGSEPATNMAYPEVYGLEQRLRLMPGETLEVEVNPDLGFNWWVMERVIDKPIRSRWRAIQGFRVSDLQLFEAGPNCLSAQTRPLARLPIPEALLPAQDLAQAVREAVPGRVEALAIATKVKLIGPDGSDNADLAAAWGERLGTLPDAAQAVALAVLPTGRMSPCMEDFDASLGGLAGPAAYAAALVTRRTTALVDAAAAYAQETGDAQLATLAEACRDDLENGGPTGYAGADASLDGYGSLEGVMEEIRAEKERQERRDRR